MRDIGRIEERLTQVEKVTTLLLLEKDAQSFETTDANGLNRFKSGFVVDNLEDTLLVTLSIQIIKTP